jgi:hypothetical protein
MISMCPLLKNREHRLIQSINDHIHCAHHHPIDTIIRRSCRSKATLFLINAQTFAPFSSNRLDKHRTLEGSVKVY